MLYAGPPQHTKSVHDGVIIAEDDKSCHTQSRTTASTNSCLKRSRRKMGMDNVYNALCMCTGHIYVYAGEFIPGTEDANLKGMQDDESLCTCTHSGVKKRTGNVCVLEGALKCFIMSAFLQAHFMNQLVQRVQK